MDARPAHETRVIWALWVACALAAAGGAVPFLLAGASGRVSGVIFPFGVAAVALGAAAALQHRGRGATTALYFVAGLAIVYGILAMMAVPLRLAVIGTCPPAPAPCAPGFQQPMTEAENTGFGFAVGMGVVAILVGFFGLVVLYRRAHAASAPPSSAPTTPPVRRIPPVRTKPAEPTTPPPGAAPVSPDDPGNSAESTVEGPAHLGDRTATPELPAPEEPLELPEMGSDEAAEKADTASPPSAE